MQMFSSNSLQLLGKSRKIKHNLKYWSHISSKKLNNQRIKTERTQIQTAGWADSQQSPHNETTPQSQFKTEGSIFKNQDVYLYKDHKELSDTKKNYLVVELKQDKKQQRSPTAQLINLKTARAQAKRQLSKIGAMQDYNVVPVTKIIQKKDRKGRISQKSSKQSSPTSKIMKKLKKYSPVRGDNLIKSLKQIQQLESPRPRRSSSMHKRTANNLSQTKMVKINEQSEAQATPSTNQLQNRNLVQQFKAVANPQQISEQEKIERLIQENSRYLQESQRQENLIKLKLEQKFSEIKEQILEYENSPDRVHKIQQQKGQGEEVQESETNLQLKQAVLSAAPMSVNKTREAKPLYDSKEKKKTLHLIQDPIFQPAKEILQQDTAYKTNYISNKIDQQRKQQDDSQKDYGQSKDFLRDPNALRIEDLEGSDDKGSEISAVQIQITRPRSASIRNFLFLQQQEDTIGQQNLPKKLESSENDEEDEENKSPDRRIISRQNFLQDQEDKNQTRMYSPHSQKINQYKRIIQINQKEPETPPLNDRMRYSRALKSKEEQDFGQRKASSSSLSSNVRQQPTQDIIQRIRSARNVRNYTQGMQVGIKTSATQSLKLQRAQSLSQKEKRLDPDLQQSLRQISRKSIVLKDADIIRNQYEVEQQKHLQELQKTLYIHQPSLPQIDQNQDLHTSQASNNKNSTNLRDSVLTINQLSMQKQTPNTAAYYYKRHTNLGKVISDGADPTASFGVGASRISDQVSNMPRKMATGETFLSGEQDISIAQQNLQLRSAFKEKLKGGSGDKKRLNQQISQACYKEVEKLIQQERRQDQLRGMRRKSKYVEVKSKVKDYIEGRSFSRHYQKISDISATTNTQSSIRKTPIQEIASNTNSSSNKVTKQFLAQKSKSPKIVRQFNLSSTAAVSTPSSARRITKTGKTGSVSGRVKNQPVIQHRPNMDIQQELKKQPQDSEVLIQRSGKNIIASSSQHTSGEILLPTIYSSTQNQSPRVQSSPPSSSSRHLKAQIKKKDSQKSKKEGSIDKLKSSSAQRQNKQYLYQNLENKHKTQQDYRREQRDHKKRQLLKKIELISYDIKQRTLESQNFPQSQSLMAKSFSLQNKNNHIFKNRKGKSKVDSSLIAHTQTSRAKIINRQERKNYSGLKSKGIKIDSDNKFTILSSYSSAPSSARLRAANKKIERKQGKSYLNSKSTLTNKNQGTWQISTNNRQLLSPELIKNLSLQTSIYREQQGTPQTVIENKSYDRNTKKITHSTTLTPRTITTSKLSKKQPSVITKVQKIQEFSSKPVNLNSKASENLSPTASSVIATKHTGSTSSSSTRLKQKHKSAPKLQLYKYQSNSYGSNQQNTLSQNPRNFNSNQSVSNYRNRQPMQGKATLTTSQTSSGPLTSRSNTSTSTFQNSKNISRYRKSQDDILSSRGQTKVAPKIESLKQNLIIQENKAQTQGHSKSLKKKWLSKQMEREKQKMAKSYKHLISTSSGLNSKSLTTQQWNKIKGAKTIQVIYEATQQSI